MNKSKIGKTLSTVAIVGLFIVVGIAVLGMMQTIKLTKPVVDIMLIIGILCFGCVSCSSAVRIIEKKRNKTLVILGYVILGLTAVTCLLWIIFVFIGQNFIQSISDASVEFDSVKNIWNYAKITALITIQTSILNLVVSNIDAFGKTMIPFQAIMYTSNVVVDGWISLALIGLKFDKSGISQNLDFLLGRGVITIFVLCLAFTLLANMVLKNITKRRSKEMVFEMYNKAVESKQESDKQANTVPQTNNETVAQDNSVEARLKKLDNLKAQGLIDDEQYKIQKARILEDI